MRPVRWGHAGRRPSVEQLLSLGVVAAAALFVFSQLHPSLIFANTTPAGGDMGAHVWGPAYMRDHLLPHFRLFGWAPSWYAGFPAFQFYFPLPSLLIVILDVLLPIHYGVAFKLVSILGLVSLPVSAWAFGRLSGMRFPGPAVLAVATVPFLFDRGFTIYGGNIPSTLAGEFSFSISLSLALLFLGVVARGADTRPPPGSSARAGCGLGTSPPSSAWAPCWPPSGRSPSWCGSRTPTTWAGRRSPSTARTSSPTTCAGWLCWPEWERSARWRSAGARACSSSGWRRSARRCSSWLRRAA